MFTATAVRRLARGLVCVAVLGPRAAGADESLAAGEIYARYCSVCHGDAGDGRSRARGSMVPPPRDFTTPQAAAELDRERMIRAVRDGRPGTAMVAWKSQLSDAQIAAVVDHIRTRFMPPIATRDVAQGRRLYAANCSVCHGDQGRGALWTGSNMQPPPRDFTSARAAVLTREHMLLTVRHGRPDTAMPGFATRLEAGEIEAVVDYVRAAFMADPAQRGSGARDAAHDAGERHHGSAGPVEYLSLGLESGLAGDRARGRVLYADNCVACHGVSGNGRGPRAYFILPKPRNFTHPGSRAHLNRPALYRAIARGKRGTEMPAWDTVLNRQQIADLAEYVFQRFIRGGDGRRAAR